MSEPSIFMTMWTFFRKFQFEYAADWRKRLAPGVKFRLTKSINTKPFVGSNKKAILDKDGNRQYVIKDPSKVYDAELIQIGPERGEKGMDTVITVKITEIVDPDTNETTEKEDTFPLGVAPYYIEVSSVQQKTGRRSRTLRRRRGRKTRYSTRVR